MTREEPRPELSNAPAEGYVCRTCLTHPVSSRWAGYTDEASHVVTDQHLEAMAHETVRDWFARDPRDPISVGVGKQIARMEAYYADYTGWLMAMALPDTPESLVISRRISAIWIAAIGHPDYEKRMAYPRKLIEMEHGKEGPP